MEADGDALDSVRMLRAIRVIEAVCDATLAVSISQLAQRVDIPKATLARLVANLVSTGYLSFVPGRRLLVPGPRAVRSANLERRAIWLRSTETVSSTSSGWKRMLLCGCTLNLEPELRSTAQQVGSYFFRRWTLLSATG